MEPKTFRYSATGKVIRTRSGCWSFIPAPVPPSLIWSGELVNVLSDAERELGRLAALSSNFPFHRILTQPFIRREAVLSSRIEGTRASLSDVYNYESSQLAFLEEKP